MWWFGDFIKDFLAIWIVLDPIAAVPVFMALVADYDARTRARIAGGSVVVALAVLVFFIVAGQLVITAVGVSLRAFTIAGGIILFLFAVDLVIGETRAPAIDPRRSSPLQLAVYPMGVPTLAGPGSMLTVMLRTDNSRISLLEWIHTMVAVVFVLAITYGLLRSAGLITRLIGSGGASILKRIMGMILAAYAVTLVLHGVADWLNLPPREASLVSGEPSKPRPRRRGDRRPVDRLESARSECARARHRSRRSPPGLTSVRSARWRGCGHATRRDCRSEPSKSRKSHAHRSPLPSDRRARTDSDGRREAVDHRLGRLANVAG